MIIRIIAFAAVTFLAFGGPLELFLISAVAYGAYYAGFELIVLGLRGGVLGRLGVGLALVLRKRAGGRECGGDGHGQGQSGQLLAGVHQRSPPRKRRVDGSSCCAQRITARLRSRRDPGRGWKSP